MNSKEIKEALKIINEPITVNCIEYKYFNEENYNKLLKVYENCLWFANNFEQINLTIENLQKENQKQKEVFNKIRKFIEENKRHEYRNGRINEYYLELNEKKLNELLNLLREVE